MDILTTSWEEGGGGADFPNQLHENNFSLTKKQKVYCAWETI
jgi:hypothetical protein